VKGSKNRSAAGELAKIFEEHFAGLPPEERAEREQAFDEAVAKIGSPSKSSESSRPQESRRVSRPSA